MKKITITVILALSLFALKAQDKDSIVTLDPVTITSYMMVNRELDKSFIKKFPEAYDIVWSRLNKDYLARFIKDDLKHQSLFKKNGYLQYDITYVDEANLPSDLRRNIKGAYDGYKVASGAKIVRAGEEFWIVNLESLTNYLVLHSNAGDIQEVKRIQRSN